MLSCERLSIVAGSFRLSDVGFVVPQGAFGVLMGATGSGKTTLLEAICGLRKLRGGTIRLHGDDITHWPISTRGIGYVPQDGAVFPRMTVRENLGFGLMMRRAGRRAIDAAVESLAEQLSIAHLLDRHAIRLSGGEAQRVALGRALAIEPRLLLLDEPLSALDESTRGQMTELLKRVQRERGITALHVTHSRQEATALADLLLQLSDGRVAEASSCDNGVVSKPATVDCPSASALAAK
jgi:ABC-type Fe3+/spermidine/putrescine transport system ATPase subunit